MLLEDADYIVTQDSQRTVLENPSLRIENGRITEVDPDLTPGKGEETMDFSGKLLMPGLVNAHTHLPMSLLRGISDDKKLEEWLEEDIFPEEERMTDRDHRLGAEIGLEEMKRTGTTSFNDMYLPGKVLEEVSQSGLRAFLGPGMIDIDSSTDEEVEWALKTIEAVEDAGHNPVVAPHSTYTCSRELLQKAWEIAEKRDIPYHIHLSETRGENSKVLEKKNARPLEVLEEVGALSKRSVLAHCVHLSQSEITNIAEKGATVVHNPAANLKLGSGIADVPRMLEEDVNVALGTDGAASNNNLDMFEEMKIAALIHKRNDPSSLTAQQVLDMATRNGADSLGIDSGRIEEGSKADIVGIDLDNPAMKPVRKERLVSHLVYSFSGPVSDVIVGGKVLR